MLKKVQSAIGRAADGVLSDMAMNTTGHRSTDHLHNRTVGGNTIFALDILNQNGFFGEMFSLMVQKNRCWTCLHNFKTVRHVKPSAGKSDLLKATF